MGLFFNSNFDDSDAIDAFAFVGREILKKIMKKEEWKSSKHTSALLVEFYGANNLSPSLSRDIKLRNAVQEFVLELLTGSEVISAVSMSIHDDSDLSAEVADAELANAATLFLKKKRLIA